MDHNNTLCIDAQLGNLHSVKRALERGGSALHSCDKHFADRTALIRAAEHGHTAIVQVLLEAGADVDHVDRSKKTALLHAAYKGHAPVVQALLAFQGDAPAPDDHTTTAGETALLLAAKFGQHEVVEVLLAAGAGTEMVDAVEITPLQYAAEAGHAPTVELLLAAGAQVNRRTAKGSTALLMAATTTVGLSPLHLRVARPDFPAVVRALVHAGADVNLPGQDGLTPLMAAMRWGKDMALVEPLVEAGADINARDHTKRTPVMFGAFSDFAKGVRYLVKRGADWGMQNDDGWTAETIAIKQEHHDVRRVFSTLRMRSVAPELYEEHERKQDRLDQGLDPETEDWPARDESKVPPHIRALYEDQDDVFHEEL